MASVFVSHSKHDKDLVKYFSQIFASIGLKAKFMEWEQLEGKYAGQEITKIIRSSWLSGHDTSAVFILLGQNLMTPPTFTPIYTHNWVNFEAGVAAGVDKRVWVFEQFGQSIQFPIPYVTDYSQYILDNVQHLRIYGSLLKSIFIDGIYVEAPIRALCPYMDCNASFRYWNSEKAILCPVCRRQINFP